MLHNIEIHPTKDGGINCRSFTYPKCTGRDTCRADQLTDEWGILRKLSVPDASTHVPGTVQRHRGLHYWKLAKRTEYKVWIVYDCMILFPIVGVCTNSVAFEQLSFMLANKCSTLKNSRTSAEYCFSCPARTNLDHRLLQFHNLQRVSQQGGGV